MASLHPPLDNAQDAGQVLYTSLLVLGLDAAGLEWSLRTPVNQKMFTRMNKKLGEHILHFLFVCIDRDKASKVFRDCWPLLDKRQESQFYKATFEWYKSLQQNYGQPVPTVVAKTFMSPGGPKFITILRTLTRIAHHATCTREDPERNILNFPTISRCPEKNRAMLTLLRASKQAHQREFILRQKIEQNVLKKVQEKAKELSGMYRSLCSQSDKAAASLQDALRQNVRLTQHQKETLPSRPLSDVQKEIQEDISKMNSEAKRLWDRVEVFRQVEESSWKILSPLLNGTTSLSHIDGSMYSVQVPDMIYKEHAAEINKLGLQGLYQEDKLDLLSLVQYANLALKSLLQIVQKTHSQAKPESTEELNVLMGRVASWNETVDQLTTKLNTLLPELMESVAVHRQHITLPVPTLESIEQDGKPNLCPPTPPLCLVNTPVVANGGPKYAPLMLTPGVHKPHAKGPQKEANTTPSRMLSTHTMTRAARRSPKASVLYSSETHKDDSVLIVAGEEAKVAEAEEGLPVEMLTVDCRVRYQRKKQEELEALLEKYQPQKNREGKKTVIPKRTKIPKENKKPLENNALSDCSNRGTKKVLAKVEMNLKETNMKNGNGLAAGPDYGEDLDSSLINRLAEVVATDDNDSGTAELMAESLSCANSKEGSALDSGCAEGSGSETLLDAIEKMSITPRKKSESKLPQNRPGSAKKYGTPFRSITSQLSNSYTETPDISKGSEVTQPANLQVIKLIDFTPCGQPATNNCTPVGTPTRDPFKTPIQKQAAVGKNTDVSRQLLASLSLDKKEENAQEVPKDLMTRMSLLTQSPVRSAAIPQGSKILAKFSGLELQEASRDTRQKIPDSTETSRGAAIAELRHHAKTNLCSLIEQMQKMKQVHQEAEGIKESRPRVGSKSNFLSYVEKLKAEKNQINSGSESKHLLSLTKDIEINTDKKEPQSDAMTWNEISSVKETADKILTDNKTDFLNNMTRMQDLLGDDDDDEDTLTGSCCESKIFEETLEKEIFTNSRDIEKMLFKTPGRRSSYLSEDSVFDTLTDAILVGEAKSSILREEGAKAEARRESISTRRQSLASTGRMSVGSNRRLSDVFSVFQNRTSAECPGILDVSDSCLLSTSMDEI